MRESVEREISSNSPVLKKKMITIVFDDQLNFFTKTEGYPETELESKRLSIS
jgi:hypothetical protein